MNHIWWLPIRESTKGKRPGLRSQAKLEAKVDKTWDSLTLEGEEASVELPVSSKSSASQTSRPVQQGHGEPDEGLLRHTASEGGEISAGASGIYPAVSPHQESASTCLNRNIKNKVQQKAGGGLRGGRGARTQARNQR